MSLDVVSVFTNIPQDLVINIIKKNWRDWSRLVKIPLELVIELVKYCFNCSYFSFNGALYKQLDESAMGNPASPILANLVVNDAITEILKILPFTTPLLKIYVGNSIMPVPEDFIDNLLIYFNNYHKKIQFTMELEVDGCIPFLDLKVIRTDQDLKTDRYIKPTHSKTHKFSV